MAYTLFYIVHCVRFLHIFTHFLSFHQTLGGCVCSSGFAGPDCSETVTPATGVWEVLSDVADLNVSISPVARMGHTMVHGPGFLLVYAGYSLAHGFLSDLLRFNLSTNTWTHIEVNQMPSQVPAARFLHSAVFSGVNNKIITTVRTKLKVARLSYFHPQL